MKIYYIRVSWHIPFGSIGSYIWKDLYFEDYDVAEYCLSTCREEVIKMLGSSPQNICYFEIRVKTLKKGVIVVKKD